MTKRAADKQLTKDDADLGPSDEDQMVQDRQTATEDVLAQRRIVKVKRTSELTAEPIGAAFASLSTPLQPVSPKAGTTASPKQANDSPKPSSKGSPSSPKSNKPPSPSHSAASSPRFGPTASFFAPFSNPFASLVSATPSSETSPQPAPLFGNFASFGSAGFGTFGNPQDEGADEEPPKEEPTLPALTEVLSGEEGETLLYQHDCKLFKLTKISCDHAEEFGEESRIATVSAGDESRLGLAASVAASAGFRWVEKGAGFVRVLQNKSGKIRIVVRMKGVLRVLLNSPPVPREGGMFQKEGAKSIKFKGFDETGSIAWFRINLLQVDQQDAFVEAAGERV